MGIEIGIQNLHSGSCRDGWGDGLGMSVVVQASQCDSTVHVQGLFLPQMKQQMIMTSFQDVSVILLT